MITPNKAIAAIYKALNVPDVTSVITGSVQKGKRETVMTGSATEDIVIMSLAAIGGQLQEGYLNVNIHVPDLKQEINGVSTVTANYQRMDIISDVVILIIEDIYTEESEFWITNLMTFEDAELKEHYLNLKVRFGHPNY